MEGYDVVTSEDSKVGRVVEEHGDFLIVEHGTLVKHRRAIPKAFAHGDEAQRLVRVSVSKEIVESSPEIDGDFDERTVAAYYGLTEESTAPETDGDGGLSSKPS